MDASLPSAAAAASGFYHLDISLFAGRAGGETVIRFFDGDGLPLSRGMQRKLEGAVNSCAAASTPERSRCPLPLTGTEEACLSRALQACGSLRGLRLSCSSPTLQRAFEEAGAEVCPPEDGMVELRCAEDGFTLCAADERGRVWPWGRLLCALTAAELRAGANAVVLPYDAPALAETIAQEYNGTIYRLDRDGEEARRLWRAAPWCRDALSLSIRLFSLLTESGRNPDLAALMDSLPEYHTQEQILHLEGPEAAVLRRLSGEKGAETVSGVRLRQGECTATIRRTGVRELRILTESSKMEAAAEFSDSLRNRIRQLDRT